MTSQESREKEPTQHVKINIFQSNTYKTDLARSNFDDQPRF